MSNQPNPAKETARPETALDRAIERAGGQVRLAEICGVTQPSVWAWVHRRGGVVPAEAAPKIEEATGIGRSELRPDLWPTQEQAA